MIGSISTTALFFSLSVSSPFMFFLIIIYGNILVDLLNKFAVKSFLLTSLSGLNVSVCSYKLSLNVLIGNAIARSFCLSSLLILISFDIFTLTFVSALFGLCERLMSKYTKLCSIPSIGSYGLSFGFSSSTSLPLVCGFLFLFWLC